MSPLHNGSAQAGAPYESRNALRNGTEERP